MFFKLIVIIFLAIILYVLGSGLYYLTKEKGRKDSIRVVKALSWRIGLSLFLFILLIFAYAMGWIAPHNI